MRIVLFLSILFLAACSSKYDSKYSTDNYGTEDPPNVYTVQKGDTLFAISWRYGLDQKTVMRNNGIQNPDKIYIGQKLYLYNNTAASAGTAASTASSSSSGKPLTTAPTYGNWVWPMRGKILRRFSAGKVGANGIRIAGKSNQTVNAAGGGVVAYKGNGLTGYGNVIIIKHDNGLLSAYGFLSKTYVKEGQKIKKRQKIGTVGYATDNRLMLHFEVRKNGRPTNPMNYIGSRYHF